MMTISCSLYPELTRRLVQIYAKTDIIYEHFVKPSCSANHSNPAQAFNCVPSTSPALELSLCLSRISPPSPISLPNDRLQSDLSQQNTNCRTILISATNLSRLLITSLCVHVLLNMQMTQSNKTYFNKNNQNTICSLISQSTTRENEQLSLLQIVFLCNV